MERRLITSQIDTAPKQAVRFRDGANCLITSQIDTAPKLMHPSRYRLPV